MIQDLEPFWKHCLAMLVTLIPVLGASTLIGRYNRMNRGLGGDILLRINMVLAPNLRAKQDHSYQTLKYSAINNKKIKIQIYKIV